MERHFDEELKEIKTNLLQMSAMAEKSIADVVSALEDNDAELARKVIGGDGAVNKLEMEIERKVFELLALRQPIAKDLRFLTTALRINTDLERIADLAVNIAERTFEITQFRHNIVLEYIPKLEVLARKMVKMAIDSFVNGDAALAAETVRLDAEADALKDGVYKKLTENYIPDGGEPARAAVCFILISRHLERICDHARYIAQEVIYVLSAQKVRHCDINKF